MTVGIYSIYWGTQDLVYIGQSLNIERRFRNHLNSMTKGTHTNYKVQRAYDLYGKPDFYIIEECTASLCNDNEIYWTEEFNSLSNKYGLNIINAGASVYGTLSRYTKYSRFTILKAFSLLYNTSLSIKEISIRLSISISTLFSIKNGHTHCWLKEIYLDKYTMMQNRKTHIVDSYTSSANIVYIRSPENVEYAVQSIAKFCRSIPELSEHLSNSSSGIRKLINGITTSYKGWELATKK